MQQTIVILLRMKPARHALAAHVANARHHNTKCATKMEQKITKTVFIFFFLVMTATITETHCSQ